MKASLRWLRELCPLLPDDPSVLATRLTAAGVEVEAVTAFGAASDGCVLAAVASSRPHPSRSGLRLVTVDRGGATQEVVCGAPNVPEAGHLVVLAPLGAHLPAKGTTIERRSIAGVTSEGMLCSEEELGLGDDAGGILVFPAGLAAPGTPLSRAVPASRDTVLELGVTPNRSDCLGHVGVAREAAALFRVPFERAAPAVPERTRDDAVDRHVKIAIDDGERCPHYGASLLFDVNVAPSPLDVRWRLAALGVRAISNVVDVTNWVMLELGHPMHAFDLDRVREGRIVVRLAKEGETLRTLDGAERSLSVDDLVIADGVGAVALAGVMGGETSEIRAATRRVLLECAYFDPRGVRRAARRHGLHTESSHRFERGVDSADTREALARAAQMMNRLAGAAPAREALLVEARPVPRRTVALRHARVEGLLGVEVPEADGRAILERLGFALRSSQAGLDAWDVPTHRADIAREVDLIEEVARVRGYDQIPAKLPALAPSRDRGPRQALARRAREAATSLGLSEAITYSFVSPRDLERVGAPAAGVALTNPLREEQSVMRTCLLPGLLHVLAHGRRHGERDVRLVSVGTVFASKGEPATNERLSLVAALAGERAIWLGPPVSVDVWDGKGLVEALVLRLIRREATVRPAPAAGRPGYLHPRGAAAVEIAGQLVGWLGPIHPDVADAFDVGPDLVVAELDLEELDRIGVRRATFSPLPRFPASVRDLAVVVRDEVTAGDVQRAVSEAAGDLAEQVTLFDRFVGGTVPAGHASLALHVVYRARDRTLTDAEVDARHAQVVAKLETQFGGQLRA